MDQTNLIPPAVSAIKAKSSEDPPPLPTPLHGHHRMRCPWVYLESGLSVSPPMLYMTPCPHSNLILSPELWRTPFLVSPPFPLLFFIFPVVNDTRKQAVLSQAVSVTGFASLFSHHRGWMGFSREAQPVLPRTSLVWQPIPRHSSKQHPKF